MKVHTAANIRNVALVGHSGSGSLISRRVRVAIALPGSGVITNGTDRSFVDRPARLGAVEIHDVKASDSMRGEAGRHRAGIFAIDGGVVVASLAEAHARAPEQIDGRDQLEGHQRASSIQWR